MGLLLNGKVYDECLETVETITETINYPLVRKEARALRLLIKSALIVLHIHCLKSEWLVSQTLFCQFASLTNDNLSFEWQRVLECLFHSVLCILDSDRSIVI